MQSNNLNNNSSDYNSASSKDVYNNLYLSEDSSIDSGVENRFRAKNVSTLCIYNIYPPPFFLSQIYIYIKKSLKFIHRSL